MCLKSGLTPLQYELDSLAGFLKMASRYYEQTKDDSFINDNCEWVAQPQD